MTGPVFRFGRCEVHVARRQVVLDGEDRSLEPRPFDALVYLLEHRERVVSKEELLDAVWPHRHVSQGVISRAISLIRKAIGDDGGEGALLRTIHGVGLRFVGEVEAGDAGPFEAVNDREASAGIVPLAVPRSRDPAALLAVLPFENLTGDSGLDWIEFGLSSLTAHGLGQADGIEVVPLPSLQMALKAVPRTADASQRAQAVRRLLGVELLLRVQVRRDQGGFRLDYWHGAPRAGEERGTLHGSDLVTLADELARVVGVALSPAGEVPALAAQGLDSPSREAFARAMQAAGEQKWKQASHLLHVALDMDPESAIVKRELFTCLATIGDDSALPWGRALLDEAESAGQAEAMGFVHHMLGRCHALQRRPEPARQHLEDALCLSREHGPWEWTAMAMQYRFELAMHHGELERAWQLMDVMRESWADSSNQCLRIRWLFNVSMTGWRSGDMVRAMHASWAARELSAEMNLAGDLATATASLGVECGELGLLASAIEHGEEALAAGLKLAEPTIVARVACTLCWLYRETRSPDGSRRIVASLGWPEYQVAAGLPGLSMARGHHAAAEGRHGEAVGHWREAVDRARGQQALHAEHVALPWLLVALVQSGSVEEAHRLLEQARRRPDITGYPRMVAALQHGEAFALHASGERDAALALLSKVAEEAPVSHWRAVASMDAAWLHLDVGRVDAARQLTRDLGSWLEEHPVGRMLKARLSRAGGGSAPERLLVEATSVPVRCLPSRA